MKKSAIITFSSQSVPEGNPNFNSNGTSKGENPTLGDSAN
jgi:hypothetical protein